MPKFPKREADIDALARQMIAGYKAHAADFPSILWLFLDIKCFVYAFARKGQIEAHSQLLLATDNKNAGLDTLRELMKNCLKKSAVDTSGNPQKLALIGWGPKAAAQMIEAPSPPVSLRAAGQGKGTIRLLWKNPSSGGAVRNYIIQRREQLAEGDFSSWSIVGSAFNNEIRLNEQPQCVQLEYRIKAVNTGGESVPSNTAAVVL